MKFSIFSEFRYFDIYGIIKLIKGDTLQLTNTYWPLAILSLTGLAYKNGLYIYMMRQFFRGVPDELEESAYIDGSGPFRTFLSIIIPLSVPMMITIFLFAFSWQWTDSFYSGLFFSGNRTTKLLPTIIVIPKTLNAIIQDGYAGANLYRQAIFNTCGLLIIAPLIVIYLFCQRYLIQGIERSGITG
jgi:multiple sugar transport system permease protein